MVYLQIDRSPWLIGMLAASAMLIYFALKYQPWFVLSARAPSQKRALTGLLLGSATGILVVFACFYPTFHEIVDIRNNGQRVMADVQDIYSTRNKSGLVYHVKYRYAVSRGAGTAAYFTGEGVVPNPGVPDVQKTGQVPIAYPTDEPGASMVNFRDFVLLRALSDYAAISLAAGFLLSSLLGLGAALTFNNNVIEKRGGAISGAS
jgi:hypothetical protein